MINSLKFLPKDFTHFKDPFYKIFALNLLFQDTRFSFALYTINFWFKIGKICPKILHLSQISHFRAVVLKLGSTEPQGFGEAVAGVQLRSE